MNKARKKEKIIQAIEQVSNYRSKLGNANNQLNMKNLKLC